jgi:hypothetical protein
MRAGFTSEMESASMSNQDAGTATPEAAETATEDTTKAPNGPQDAAETSSDDQGNGKTPKAAAEGLQADLVRERRQRQTLERRLKEIEDAKLSDLERLQKQAKEANDRAEKAERAALRQQAAIKHQLTPDLAKRLQGDTENELDADAAELAKLLTPKAPGPDPSQGSRAGQGPQNMNDLIRSAVRRS